MSRDDALDPDGRLHGFRDLEDFKAPVDKMTPARASPDDVPVYAILCGADDTPTAWLRGGEALGAAGAVGQDLGILVRPLIAPVDLEARMAAFEPSREDRSQPFLVLRLGRGVSGPLRREHRPATQSVEIPGETRSGPP